MSRQDTIRTKLVEAFAPESLEIINDSVRHAGHAGDDGSGESHFRIILVSSFFSGKRRVERHRMVHAVLGEVFDDGLHALSIHTYAPGEKFRQ